MTREDEIVQCLWHIRDALINAAHVLSQKCGDSEELHDLDKSIEEMTKSLVRAQPEPQVSVVKFLE